MHVRHPRRAISLEIVLLIGTFIGPPTNKIKPIKYLLDIMVIIKIILIIQDLQVLMMSKVTGWQSLTTLNPPFRHFALLQPRD